MRILRRVRRQIFLRWETVPLIGKQRLGLIFQVYPAEVYRAQPGLIVDFSVWYGIYGRPLAPALVKLFSEIEQARKNIKLKLLL